MPDKFSTLVYSHLYSKVFLELFHLKTNWYQTFQKTVPKQKIKNKKKKNQNLTKSDQIMDLVRFGQIWSDLDFSFFNLFVFNFLIKNNKKARQVCEKSDPNEL